MGETAEEREWRTQPADLGTWANRAMKVKAERDALRQELERLRSSLPCQESPSPGLLGSGGGA